MLGAIFLLAVIAVVGVIVVQRLGWKGAGAAFVALGAGLWAGGKQVVDAFEVFFGSVF